MTGQQLMITAGAIPSALDAGTDHSAGGTGGVMDFFECHALREKHELEKWGDLDRCPTAMESLEYWRGNEYEERRLFVARLGQETVGTCSVTLPLRENTSTAGIMVDVAAAFRRRGWGRRLLEHAEAVAADSVRTSLDAYCELPAGPVENAARLIPAKSGAVGLPADDPAVAFAAGAGYELEQVERSSRLTLPVPANQLDTLEMEACSRATGYVLVGWSDTCPDELLAECAVLKNRMSKDVPIAGLDWEAGDWDPARHRGKRLGLLIKAANLRTAQHRWPAARSVLTWNAVENRHMLAINNLFGFKPAGYEGEWQKRLG
ncbi:GNAT family N-acetyltransferase [Pseudarthrobacter sp. MDT1-22]